VRPHYCNELVNYGIVEQMRPTQLAMGQSQNRGAVAIGSNHIGSCARRTLDPVATAPRFCNFTSHALGYEALKRVCFTYFSGETLIPVKWLVEDQGEY